MKGGIDTILAVSDALGDGAAAVKNSSTFHSPSCPRRVSSDSPSMLSFLEKDSRNGPIIVSNSNRDTITNDTTRGPHLETPAADYESLYRRQKAEYETLKREYDSVLADRSAQIAKMNDILKYKNEIIANIVKGGAESSNSSSLDEARSLLSRLGNGYYDNYGNGPAPTLNRSVNVDTNNMKTIADLKFENAALYEANRILAERLQLVESDKKRNPPLRQEFFDLKKTLDQTRSALWKAEGGLNKCQREKQSGIARQSSPVTTPPLLQVSPFHQAKTSNSSAALTVSPATPQPPAPSSPIPENRSRSPPSQIVAASSTVIAAVGVTNKETPTKKRCLPSSAVSSRHQEEDAGGDGRFRPYQGKHWTQQFYELCEYRKRCGNCMVPYAYAENPTLARWVKRQRYQHKLFAEGKSSTMTPERAKLLNDIGFVWDLQSSAWYERLNELRAFRKAFKTCNVPSEWSENRQLAIWVKCQRRQYKLYNAGEKCNMTPERIAELDGLGFEWRLRHAKSRQILIKKSPSSAKSEE